MFTLILPGQWDSALVLDTLIMDMDTEEVTGAIPDMLGDTLGIGEADGATLATTDLIMDTIITLIATEEEDQLLIMQEEIMHLTETTLPTEAITQVEITPQTEAVTIQTDKVMGFLTIEEVLLQMAEHTTILPAQPLLTEEVILKVKVTVTTILTEDQAARQPEVMTAATLHPEATLLAHHAQ